MSLTIDIETYGEVGVGRTFAVTGEFTAFFDLKTVDDIFDRPLLWGKWRRRQAKGYRKYLRRLKSKAH